MFVNNWGENIHSLHERYKYFTPCHDNKWDNLEATEELKSADFLIVMSGLPNNRNSLIGKIFNLLDKEYPDKNYLSHKKKICLQREPVEVSSRIMNYNNTVFYGSYENFYHASTWFLRKSFKELDNLKIPNDIKSLSAVVSNKRSTHGQRRRLDMIASISKIYPEIDIYGRNLEFSTFGESYKGSIDYNGNCKFNGLYKYKYSLAFENSSHRNYFTEKLIDCFLCWTKPIYWGCPNISDYFPAESFAYVDIFGEDVEKKILEELSKPVDYDALKEARELVLNKYNIWPSVKHIIDSYEKDD